MGTLGPLPGEGQGAEGHGASAVPSLTWRGCQVHTGGRIRGQAAVGARLGHRVLNRGTYWSGLGAQPAPIGHCCHQAEGQGSGFGGWGPSALGAAERRWRGDARLSSCWQKAAAPLPGGAWPVGWLCSPALVTLLLPPTQVHGPSRTHDGPGRPQGKWAGPKDQSHCCDASSDWGASLPTRTTAEDVRGKWPHVPGSPPTVPHLPLL